MFKAWLLLSKHIKWKFSIRKKLGRKRYTNKRDNYSLMGFWGKGIGKSEQTPAEVKAGRAWWIQMNSDEFRTWATAVIFMILNNF